MAKKIIKVALKVKKPKAEDGNKRSIDFEE